MPTAADIKDYTKPEVAPLYTYSAEIDTTPEAQAPTWATICAGFDKSSGAFTGRYITCDYLKVRVSSLDLL